jgi:hypothetical protein
MRDSSGLIMLLAIGVGGYLLYQWYQTQPVAQTVAPGGLPLNTPVNTPAQMAAYQTAISTPAANSSIIWNPGISG